MGSRQDGGQPRSGSAVIAAPITSDSECGTGRAAERHGVIEQRRLAYG